MILRLKRGVTFRTRLTLTDDPWGLTGAAVTAQVRRGNLVADLVVRILSDAPGRVEIEANAETTAAWPCALLACDVRVAQPGGEVFATETFHINVIPEVTRD